MEAHAYTASAFHESLEDGRAAGELWVMTHGLVFQNGANRMELPFAGLQVEPGAKSGEGVLSMRHPLHPGWTIYTSDRAVLDDPILQAQPSLQALLVALLRRRARRRLMIVLALLGLAVFVLALIFTAQDSQ